LRWYSPEFRALSPAVVAGVAAILSVAFFTMLFWLLWVAVASVMLFLASRPQAAAGSEPSAATP
jgi:hypothetical protein